MNNKIYLKATYITGCDNKGNEYAYWDSNEDNSNPVPSMGGWQPYFDSYTERYLSASDFELMILPKIVKVRFGNVEMTRLEWIDAGCPKYIEKRKAELLPARNASQSSAYIRGAVNAADEVYQAETGAKCRICEAGMINKETEIYPASNISLPITCPCCNGNWQNCLDCADEAQIEDLMQAHNAKVKDVPLYKLTPADCKHARETGSQTGMLCRDCGQVREPVNEFEKQLVGRYNFQGTGYVNWRGK